MKYTNVSFEFRSDVEPTQVSRGVVVTRPGEMVLEVEYPGERPYTIVGVEHDGVFVGRHQGQPGDVMVKAQWSKKGDVWVGAWVEEGIDYAFTFELD